MPGPFWVLSTVTLELHKFALWESFVWIVFKVNPAGLHGPQLVEFMDVELCVQWANLSCAGYLTVWRVSAPTPLIQTVDKL